MNRQAGMNDIQHLFVQYVLCMYVSSRVHVCMWCLPAKCSILEKAMCCVNSAVIATK